MCSNPQPVVRAEIIQESSIVGSTEVPLPTDLHDDLKVFERELSEALREAVDQLDWNVHRANYLIELVGYCRSCGGVLKDCPPKILIVAAEIDPDLGKFSEDFVNGIKVLQALDAALTDVEYDERGLFGSGNPLLN